MLRDEINALSMQAHQNAEEHGFYSRLQYEMDAMIDADEPSLAEDIRRTFVVAALGKIGSEAGEAISCAQKKLHNDGLDEELADIVIRVFDLAAFMGIPIGDAIMAKMEKNKGRPYMHGKLC